MKTKFISIAATLLLAASVSSISAQDVDWVNYSAVYVNGTWYKCSSNNADWHIEYFNGQNLGEITSLEIGGQCYMHCTNNWNYPDWTMTMGYAIDGVDMTHTLSWNSYDNGYYTMCFQSGGQNWNPETINISGLNGGKHTLAVWFTKNNHWDSNNGANYVATFTINKPIELGNNDENNSNIIARNNGYTGDVQLTGRTLVGGQWNTLCLPFDLAVSGSIFTDVKTLSSSSFNSNNGELGLTFSDATTIEAGKPYLVKVNSDIANPTFTNVTISAADPGQIGSEPATFKGTFNPIEYTEENKNILYLGAGDQLYYPSPTSENPSVTIGAFRAYFELGEGITAGEPLTGEQGIKSFVLNFGDDNETTSIKTISESSDHSKRSDVYYTLDGRRLNDKPATAGLYIINGKKVVIK